MSPFTGVVLGALATLAGTGLQLWFNARNRERDRFMQLRRDVYFEASEGLAAGIEYLFQNARSDVALGAVPAPKGNPGWLYKLHLVAETKTLIALNEAAAAAASGALDVFISRVRVAEIEDEIKVIQSAVGQLQRFQEDMKADARGVNMATPSEQGAKRLQWIQEQLEVSRDQVREETTKLEQLSDEHARSAREALKKAFELAAPVMKTIRDALLAARSELAMEIDAGEFEAAAAAIDDAMTRKLNELIAQIK